VKWTPIDSYHLLNRMGYTLAFLAVETERAAASSRIGAGAAEVLFPDNTPIQEPIQPNGQHAARFDFRALPPPGAPDTSAASQLAATNAFLPSSMLARAEHIREQQLGGVAESVGDRACAARGRSASRSLVAIDLVRGAPRGAR
jgi:hypothetical protein